MDISPPIKPATVDNVSMPIKRGFDIVDLKQYFHVVVKRIWLVALCFVISVSVTVVMLMRQVPVFRTSTTMLFSKGLELPREVKMKEQEVWGEYMETQLRILQSNLIIARAREAVNRPADEISRKLVRVWAEQAWKAAFVYIRVESLDPVFAADFANAMAEQYLDFKAEERMDTSQATVVSLTQQANRIREELRKAEERVLAFEKENSVVAISERGNIAASLLASLSADAAGLRTQRMLLEAQQPLLNTASDDIVLNTLLPVYTPIVGMAQPSIATMAAGTNAAGGYSRAPEMLLERGVVSEPGWAGLRRQKEILESELNALRVNLRDAHPRVQSALTDIKQVDQKLQVELKFALKQYYTKLESLAIQEQATQRAISEWEDEAIEVTRKAHTYEGLKKDIARLQGLYDLLFSRLKEVDVSIGIEPESIRVMEKAVPPGAPITPRKLQSLFLSALVGIGIGLALVFGLEYVDDSLRYPEEVTRDLGLTFLGVIPAANWDPDDLRTHVLSNIDQKSGLSESYRNVRSALLFTPQGSSIRTLAVTSAVPKEGKTTTSLNLAVSIAQAGFRVLLVDADLRRGEVHKFFGLEGGRGLSDVLSGHAKAESVIQRTGIPNLDLVATGPFPSNPAELIMRNEFGTFLEYAKRTYDKILVDCPPVMAVSESSILASMVDGVVMVVWAGHTSRKLCQLSLQSIRQRGARMLGCVLNNLEFGRVGYYYYSTYYGYYDYDYRYGRSEAPRNT
jgi:succinoglycan biosynthesis transport protein ExoP